ncbi:uncharacterized protein TNCV_256741 [Trichonephila clavipes]|nr:uncharacterized protein TNCV_256741 [Trichonephila clavipes]
MIIDIPELTLLVRLSYIAERETSSGWVVTSHITSYPIIDVSFFGSLKTYYSHACNDFMVTHRGQIFTDKKIGEPLSTTYFKAPTVGNAVKRFKECGIKSHYHFLLREHDFASAKTTDHDVVGDGTEINSANPQTLEVENQHKNPPEEPELMSNADSDAPKKPVNVFFFFISNHCLKQHNVRKKVKEKVSLSILTRTAIK